MAGVRAPGRSGFAWNATAEGLLLVATDAAAERRPSGETLVRQARLCSHLTCRDLIYSMGAAVLQPLQLDTQQLGLRCWSNMLQTCTCDKHSSSRQPAAATIDRRRASTPHRCVNTCRLQLAPWSSGRAQQEERECNPD